MNAAVVRRTQEALGKVIRRPPLTEKLLSKPPFRYLHDIITEVIRMTGFLKGLYTDSEMKSDNVKDKDAKISFLQKAIDVVVMVSGEPLLAKPARIVAGHEPERTNELLQMIGKCCLNKLSSDEAVKRVLAGEKGDARGRAVRTSKSHELDNKNTREEESRTRKGKEDRRNSEVKEKSTSRGEKQKEEPKEESKPRDRERDKEKMKESDGDRHRDPERDKLREGERERARNRAKQDRERDKGRGNKDQDKELDREEEGGRRSEGRKEQERLQGLDQERDLDRGGDREHVGARGAAHTHRPPSRAPDREKSGEQDRPGKKSASSGEMPKKPSDEAVKDSKAEAEVEISSRVSRSLASKTSKWRPKNSVEGDLPSDAEGEAGPGSGPPLPEKPEVSENPEVPSELPSSARRLPRPGSARPAPPRVKRQESTEALTMDRAGSGKTVPNVIMESRNSDSEEDEHFVVEAAPPLTQMSELEMVPAAELEDDRKHGGLVKKILETKKDYEKLQQASRPGEKEKSLVFESAWKKEKDIVCKEIEKLRGSIQTLCKSALPLGKIMDYLQEDVDAMRHELQLWHSENRQHVEALQREQSITDCAVEPLKAELAELEQQVKDQQDKICAVKANILRNEEKIQKMVYSINLTSRR
ncbi:TRAF3-interacting protein 1 isoform X2 [Heterocephalus glaber]|uniref:TRAF3-interacting protein 1 n=2 Tax=Heterocephalus glaber TaxID=10181 RepID=A0AAX6Q621_HETGA|nr:TRAF3-interacting protein 1 isoform X2 [Heterocephalus glaber]